MIEVIIMEKSRKNSNLSRKRLHQLIAVGIVTLAILIALIVIMVIGSKPTNGPGGKNPTESGSEIDTEELLAQRRKEMIEKADLLAASYDYDNAIALIKEWKGYEVDEELTTKISDFETKKAACVRVDISKVTHIFYHSLVVDTDRCFPDTPQGRQNSDWMTTIDEFKKITQEMYDRGYVLVSIHDLYKYETDENGNQIMVEGDIYLPADKKAFVLSLDDLSYYHSYDNFGFASKLILDENGKVINEYIDAEGNVKQGLYDCVPLLDQFIEEHPDASYRGAKGTVALTGYNGIFGYRTDESYTFDNINNPDIDKDKRQWLMNHPEFDLEKERAAAKEIADAMKANGWTFASHTWGHLPVGRKTFSSLKADNQRWQKNVAPLVGETNVIIFAHGEDLGKWGNYNLSDEKVKYFMEQGFDVFCNVDGSAKYLTHFGGTYLRQGRRNFDGIRFYYNLTGQQNNLSDLFDVKEIVDSARPYMKDFN